MKKRRASSHRGRARLLALISLMTSAGCATLSGLSSLDEVQCVDTCDGGGTLDKDSGLSSDSPSVGEDGGGDANAGGDGSSGDAANKDGALSDATGPVIACGGKNCSGADPECCTSSGVNTFSCEPTLASCLDAGEYGFACTKTSDCTSAADPVCCLSTSLHSATCTTSGACPLSAGNLRRLCNSDFLADPICGASYDCMEDLQFMNFNSCQ